MTTIRKAKTMAKSVIHEVELLNTNFPMLKRCNMLILHEAIEEIIGLSRTSSRYRTIVRRWQEDVLDRRNIVLDGRAAHGQGLLALTAGQMVQLQSKSYRHVERTLEKGIRIAEKAPDSELTQAERQERTHNATLTRVMQAHLMSRSTKTPTPPLTVVASPKDVRA